jgi:hypothetical protein
VVDRKFGEDLSGHRRPAPGSFREELDGTEDRDDVIRFGARDDARGRGVRVKLPKLHAMIESFHGSISHAEDLLSVSVGTLDPQEKPPRAEPAEPSVQVPFRSFRSF